MTFTHKSKSFCTKKEFIFWDGIYRYILADVYLYMKVLLYAFENIQILIYIQYLFQYIHPSIYLSIYATSPVDFLSLFFLHIYSFKNYFKTFMKKFFHKIFS